MCRAGLTEAAAPAVASLLVELRDALAAQVGADPASCSIGPVDLGDEPDTAGDYKKL